MLPPGHIAAGYIVSYSFLKLAHPALSLADQRLLLYWGTFFSFAPDLDSFLVFIKMKKMAMGDEHRKFYSHAPINWFIAGLAISSVALWFHSLFFEYFGVLVWLGSWTHFTLDTIQYGIMWFWPIHKEVIAFSDKEVTGEADYGKGFFRFWIDGLKYYMTDAKLSFYSELVLIVIALLIYFH